MKRIAALLSVFILSGCGGSSSPPVVTGPAPTPPSPGSMWSMNYSHPPGSVAMHPLGDREYFDFPRCAKISGVLPCSVNYVERPFGNVAGAPSLTLDYEITGDAPTFSHETNVDNTCGGPSTVQLFLRMAGDPNMQNPNSRWFSQPSRQTLAIRKNTYTVPLTLDQWTPVYPPGQQIFFNMTLGNIATAGFVFGGGCFAGHGVGLTEGSARFWVVRFGT